MSSAGFFVWETAVLRFELRLPDGQPATEFLQDADEVVVTISQGSSTVEKTGDDVGVDADSATVVVNLSQRETSRFRGGTRSRPRTASAQVNVHRPDRTRDATFEADVAVWRNLHGKEMR